jgi:hypothetical protein
MILLALKRIIVTLYSLYFRVLSFDQAKEFRRIYSADDSYVDKFLFFNPLDYTIARKSRLLGNKAELCLFSMTDKAPLKNCSDILVNLTDDELSNRTLISNAVFLVNLYKLKSITFRCHPRAPVSRSFVKRVASEKLELDTVKVSFTGERQGCRYFVSSVSTAVSDFIDAPRVQVYLSWTASLSFLSREQFELYLKIAGEYLDIAEFDI